LALVPCVLSILIGLRFLDWMSWSNGAIEPFTDAITYQAAGERLAAGHELYALAPGDRAVLRVLGTSDAPLLSPPPIAAIWRVLVVIPFGFEIWVIACWTALLQTTFLLVQRTGLRGALVASLLAPCIGEQLAACNMAAFFPGLLAIAWVNGSSRVSGAIVGVLAGFKISPGSLTAWILGARRDGSSAMVLTVAGCTLLSVFVAAPDAIAQYFGVLAKGVGPSWLSLSGLTGLGWLSPAVLASGTLLALGLKRWPAVSFSTAVAASVLGSPALYLSSLVTLLSILAPLGWPTQSRAGSTTEFELVGAGGMAFAPASST
jgi:hypothetical protein